MLPVIAGAQHSARRRYSVSIQRDKNFSGTLAVTVVVINPFLAHGDVCALRLVTVGQDEADT